MKKKEKQSVERKKKFKNMTLLNVYVVNNRVFRVKSIVVGVRNGDGKKNLRALLLICKQCDIKERWT